MSGSAARPQTAAPRSPRRRRRTTFVMSPALVSPSRRCEGRRPAGPIPHGWRPFSVAGGCCWPARAPRRGCRLGGQRRRPGARDRAAPLGGRARLRRLPGWFPGQSRLNRAKASDSASEKARSFSLWIQSWRSLADGAAFQAGQSIRYRTFRAECYGVGPWNQRRNAYDRIFVWPDCWSGRRSLPG